MEQSFIFNPYFCRKSKSVYFTSGLSVPFLKYHDISADEWNYKRYGYNPDTTFQTDPKLKPTKYESYEYLDLMDIGDRREAWAPVWAVLGFKDYPSRYKVQSFMFGDIQLYVFKVRNEVGEYWLKVEGNTTRKVLDLIFESIQDLFQWFQDHPEIAEKVTIEWGSKISC